MNFLRLSEIEPRFLGRPTCSLVGIMPEKSWLPASPPKVGGKIVPVHAARACGGVENNFSHSKPQHLMEASFMLRAVLLPGKQLPVSIEWRLCGPLRATQPSAATTPSRLLLNIIALN
jgi:hypothetical protein